MRSAGWRRRRIGPSVSGAAVSIELSELTYFIYCAATYERRNALRAGTLTRAIFDQDNAGRLELLSGGSIIAVIGAALR